MLAARVYIWIDGGTIASTDGFWRSIASEFEIPESFSYSDSNDEGISSGVNALVSASGSVVRTENRTEHHNIDSFGSAIDLILSKKIVLVIDDFHYIEPEVRKDIVRNIKGAVFNGLKVILLSVTHRAFDAIKDESELTGRFISVALPEWNIEDLRKIPELGFRELNVKCSDSVIDNFVNESQSNPFLMQKFCWEICFDNNIDTCQSNEVTIGDGSYSPKDMYIRLARDAGLPIYQKLAAGPQSRKERARRPLVGGGDVDIYEATLRAIAETGPKSKVNYDEIRSMLGTILQDLVPQKHEVTSALKHLTAISREMDSDSAIDWDEDSREVTVADPYLRFYLRWQVKGAEPTR